MKNYWPKSSPFSPVFRIIASFVCFCFLSEILASDLIRLRTDAFAQMLPNSNLVMPSVNFTPPTLKAIHVDPQTPLKINFIIDGADQETVSQKDVKRLIQYFLAALTTPEKEIWVNLSPYEKNRIIALQFGETSAGRELLSQDNLLKQLASSLTYPESETGKQFWDKVYKKAYELYGTTEVPIDTFQRVWIMPEKAVVYEYEGTAFVTESRLKVLLEDDYLALKNNNYSPAKIQGANYPNTPVRSLPEKEASKVNRLSATITRQIILPEIEKEINTGKNFVPLRQIFHALILATWFKKKLRQHILSRVYVDRKKVKGIVDDSDQTADRIYQKYIRVLKEGVYNYVREDFDASTLSVIPRQYFSGGFSIGDTEEWLSIRPISKIMMSSRTFLSWLGKKLLFVIVKLLPQGTDGDLALPRILGRYSGKNLRRYAAGGLAALALGTAMPGGAQTPAPEPVPPTPIPYSQNILPVDLPSQMTGESYLAAPKAVEQTVQFWQKLKGQLTLQDVINLNKLKNPNSRLKDPTYHIDVEYFKTNWDHVFNAQSPQWVRDTLIIAWKHKNQWPENPHVSPKMIAKLSAGPASITPKAVQTTPDYLKLGQTITVQGRKSIEDLKTVVTPQDVSALAQVTDPKTGKNFSIDENHFRENWDNIFKGQTYGPDQRAVVFAAQNKYNLSRDGLLGPETRKAIEEIKRENDRLARQSAAQPQPTPAHRQIAGPPPPKDKHITNIRELLPDRVWERTKDGAKAFLGFLVYLNSFAFEALLTIVFGIQSFRIFRESRQNPSDRAELLKLLTKYLQGDPNQPFEQKPQQLISRQASLNDMIAKVVGNQVEVIIRSGNSLNFGGAKPRQLAEQTEAALRKLIDDGDLRFMHGQSILNLNRSERKSTRLKLVFDIPSGERINGKGVTVFYRGTKNEDLKSFQMGVTENSFDELEDFWEEMLKPGELLTQEQLTSLIKRISEYRNENPIVFKDFRPQSTVAFKIRKLALATLPLIDESHASDRNYFYFLARLGNLMRYIFAPCATIDTFKSAFLPARDDLNREIFGLPLDKFYRVVTLVELAYFRSQKTVRKALPEYYNIVKNLDMMEDQLLSTTEEDSLPRSQYSVGTLRSEFDQFSMSIEKPHANSIVGLDLFRRHGRVWKAMKDLVMLLSPLIIWLLAGGSSMSVWIPFLIGFIVFGFVNYGLPKYGDIWARGERKNYEILMEAFRPEQMPNDFVSEVLPREKLLEHLTLKYLPRTRWSHSRFVLAATQFSDIKAVRENSYVEIRFMADSHFMADKKTAGSLKSAILQDINEGQLGIRLSLNGEDIDIAPNRVSIEVHSTGIRLRIKNVDPQAETIEMNYSAVETDERETYTMSIMDDRFKQLINQWDHFLEDARDNHDYSGITELMNSVREFIKPGSISLTDFRKNAGYYWELRERAMATYEMVVIDQDPHMQIYRPFFLEIARYGTFVRSMSASFAGLDSLKSWYIPDGEFFNKKIFGVPLSRILRMIFGVSALYSWSRRDTLKSINQVAAQWAQIDSIQAGLPGGKPVDNLGMRAIEKKLKADFEKADFGFRYPSKNSLAGNDLYNRRFGYWVLMGYTLLLAVTLIFMAIPILVPIINLIATALGAAPIVFNPAFLAFLTSPQLFGIPVLNLSVVFYIIAYWINPIHGNNAQERERNEYNRIIDFYRTNTTHGEMQIIKIKKNKNNTFSRIGESLFYVIGIFWPTAILGYFVYQQSQSRFWQKPNGNGNGTHIPILKPEPSNPGEVLRTNPNMSAGGPDNNKLLAGGPSDGKNIAGGPPDESYAVSSTVEKPDEKKAEKKGGVDLDTTGVYQQEGESRDWQWDDTLTPEILLQKIEGMDFQIQELKPIVNPPAFIPNFAQSRSARSMISLSVP